MIRIMEFSFYGVAIALGAIIVRFLYWWWRDALITTTAMEIARKKLGSLGIVKGRPSNQILQLLSTCEFDSGAARNLVIASLYLLRSEFQLNQFFFRSLGDVPGFESSGDLPHPPIRFDPVREFVFKTADIKLKRRAKIVDQAVDRLIDNLAELREATNQPEHKAAA